MNSSTLRQLIPRCRDIFPARLSFRGVVLLDHVAAAVWRVCNRQITGLPQVKFLQPLAPEMPVQLTIEQGQAGLSFRIHAGAQLIASGLLEVAQ